jgi:hypothetical protein
VVTCGQPRGAANSIHTHPAEHETDRSAVDILSPTAKAAHDQLDAIAVLLLQAENAHRSATEAQRKTRPTQQLAACDKDKAPQPTVRKLPSRSPSVGKDEAVAVEVLGLKQEWSPPREDPRSWARGLLETAFREIRFTQPKVAARQAVVEAPEGGEWVDIVFNMRVRDAGLILGCSSGFTAALTTELAERVVSQRKVALLVSGISIPKWEIRVAVKDQRDIHKVPDYETLVSPQGTAALFALSTPLRAPASKMRPQDPAIAVSPTAEPAAMPAVGTADALEREEMDGEVLSQIIKRRRLWSPETHRESALGDATSVNAGTPERPPHLSAAGGVDFRRAGNGAAAPPIRFTTSYYLRRSPTA